MLIAASRRLLSAWSAQSSSTRRVLVFNGHPDPRPQRFCAALCEAYAEGARAAGHGVRMIRVGELPLSKDSVEFAVAREQISWSDRLFVVFPIWLGSPPPAVLRVFDAFNREEKNTFRKCSNPVGAERQSHLVMTASLPALLYRSKDAVHPRSLPGVKAGPPTIIGSVDTISAEDRRRWLWEMQTLGAKVK